MKKIIRNFIGKGKEDISGSPTDNDDIFKLKKKKSKKKLAKLKKLTEEVMEDIVKKNRTTQKKPASPKKGSAKTKPKTKKWLHKEDLKILSEYDNSKEKENRWVYLATVLNTDKTAMDIEDRWKKILARQYKIRTNRPKTRVEKMCEEMDRSECLKSTKKCHYVPVNQFPKYTKGCHSYKKYKTGNNSIQSILIKIQSAEETYKEYSVTVYEERARNVILSQVEKVIDDIANNLSSNVLKGASIKGFTSITKKKYNSMDYHSKVTYLKNLCQHILGSSS